MPINDLLDLSVLKKECRDTRDRIGNEDREYLGAPTKMDMIVHTRHTIHPRKYLMPIDALLDISLLELIKRPLNTIGCQGPQAKIQKMIQKGRSISSESPDRYLELFSL